MLSKEFSRFAIQSQEELKELRKECILHPKLIGLGGCWSNTGKGRPKRWLKHLYNDGKRLTIKVAKLVYMREFGPILTGFHILHICGDSLCVNINHLRLGSHEDNMRDIVKHRLGRDRQTYLEICAKYKTGIYSSKDLCKEYVIHPSTLFRLIKRYMPKNKFKKRGK